MAGGHNLLMAGPPGSGKSMIARRIATILPELSLEESLEITRIYSVLGMMDKEQTLDHQASVSKCSSYHNEDCISWRWNDTKTGRNQYGSRRCVIFG